MVMTIAIVPLYKHGQMMVISWPTMVNDHDQPWSPWSDHDPVTGEASFIHTFLKTAFRESFKIKQQCDQGPQVLCMYGPRGLH